MHHERQRGQSKEIFRLRGGTHVRRDKTGHVLLRIRYNDTCHITKKEAEKFGDRFEVVELPVTADDITIPEGEEENADEAQLQRTVEASTSEVDSGTVAEAMKEEAAGDTGMGDITPSEPNLPPPPPPPPSLAREDFSSDAAHSAWEDGGQPDLSNAAKSGHNGTTYSAKDVRAVTS